MKTLRHAATLSSAAVIALLVSGCVPNNASAGALSVESTETDCVVSANAAPSGTISFKVTNSGERVTEFYLLANDGLRIVGEVENIAPGTSRTLTMVAEPGQYFTACKPGMAGSGIGNAIFTVTDSGVEPNISADPEAIEKAIANYASYVRNEVDILLEETESFAGLYGYGDDDHARKLYASTRVHWERIETVAESFGDLDPILDAREADLEEGQEWTGWHAIEKDLWPEEAGADFKPYTYEERYALATGLVENTKLLHERVQDMTFTLSQIANGAIGLLDEIAKGKVTGEEEIWSHTDLWDFQANLDGANVMYEGVRPILVEKDAELATKIDTEMAALQALLDQHRVGDGFVYYNELTDAEVRALSDQVNALAEQLGLLTAALLG